MVGEDTKRPAGTLNKLQEFLTETSCAPQVTTLTVFFICLKLCFGLMRTRLNFMTIIPQTTLPMTTEYHPHGEVRWGRHNALGVL